MLAHGVLWQEGHLEGHRRGGVPEIHAPRGRRFATFARPGGYVSRTDQTIKIRCAVPPRCCPTQPALTLLRFRAVSRGIPNSLDINLAFDHIVHRNIRPRSEDELTRTVFRTLPSHIGRRPQPRQGIEDMLGNAARSLWTVSCNVVNDFGKVLCGALGPNDVHRSFNRLSIRAKTSSLASNLPAAISSSPRFTAAARSSWYSRRESTCCCRYTSAVTPACAASCCNRSSCSGLSCTAISKL